MHPSSTTPARLPWLVPLDHPAFAGHFPGHPIMPGVMLISQALEQAAMHVDPAWLAGSVQIASAKFLAPLQPGDACMIELQIQASSEGTRLRFDIRRGETLAATGTLQRPAP